MFNKKRTNKVILDDVVFIEELTWGDFKFEEITGYLRSSTESYTKYIICTPPANVTKGCYRKNIMYVMNTSYHCIHPIYIARFDGIFKISRTTQNESTVVYAEQNIINNATHRMYELLMKYRHKPIHELRDIVIATEELKQL